MLSPPSQLVWDTQTYLAILSRLIAKEKEEKSKAISITPNESLEIKAYLFLNIMFLYIYLYIFLYLLHQIKKSPMGKEFSYLFFLFFQEYYDPKLKK